MSKGEGKQPEPHDSGIAKVETQPEDDLAKLERLLQREELGRFHPELGDVYDQLDHTMQRLLDSIIKTSLQNRRVLLSRKGEA